MMCDLSYVRSGIVMIVMWLMTITTGLSQNIFRAVIRDSETREPLPGSSVHIPGAAAGATADANGRVELGGIPDGSLVVEFSFVGYETRTLTVVFPQEDAEPVEVFLTPAHEELGEITISSTRSSRTIADIPTRVETIAGEELDEKGNMKPGDIRMLLNESTGIQTQQTSPTSANASIRIQGLDGRYTQILKDGFPLYAGFSGGLGLLQTPPLDLRQVEVIKGATSTLYGGGAIAGLVNLISRQPSAEPDLRFMINGTSAGGLDLSGFYGRQFDGVGLTVFASRNSNEAYDPADIGLTAIPEFERYTLNPRVFLNMGERTSITAGVNITREDRTGGDLRYINGDRTPGTHYFERNESLRMSTQFALSQKMGTNATMTLKNSLNRFDRVVTIPDYRFAGIQSSSFTELNYSSTSPGGTEWTGGLNLWTDNFAEEPSGALVRDYLQTTVGAFLQNTVTISGQVSLETGLRGDYVIDYGFVLLPRVSLLYKPTAYFTSRLGGGFGYKAPSIFTEESERIQYRRVRPVTPDANKLEKSYGANWDLNFRTALGEDATLSVNHLFFYTWLDNPLMLSVTQGEDPAFINLPGFIDTKGTETNVKITYGDFKLFIGYTYTDTKIHNEGVTVQTPLTAKHRLNNVLMFEAEEKWKIGLEAYYFSKQRLNDGTYGQDYWICGLMAERLWEHFSLFLNFENFLDTRQTRFGSIYSGPISDPEFRDIYAPVDGFVVNGGVKVNL